MIDKRIIPALVVMGVIMTSAYAYGWSLLIIPASPPVDQVAQETPVQEGNRLFYRVTTADGDTHVIDVSRIDAAQAILTATDRYGAGATVERIVGAEAVEQEQAQAGPNPLVFTGLLILLPLTLLLAAKRLQTRSAAMERVWKTLARKLTGRGEKVMEEARVDADVLDQALDAINQWRQAELRWDRNNDRIMDLRLSHFTLTVKYCPRCNTQVHARISADLSRVPVCQSCMAPLESQELESQQAQVVERLLGEEPSGPPPDHTGFSPGAFIFWSLLFPPLAAAYALKAAK